MDESRSHLRGESVGLEKPVGFAILGTGGAAQAHARALSTLSETRLIACLSRRREAANDFGATFSCRAETDIEALLADKEISAVIVATEPEHHDLAIAVACAGRHVLVEKPLAATLMQGQNIVRACQDSKIIAAVVSQRRFDLAMAEVRRCIDRKLIGQPIFAESIVLTMREVSYFAAGNGWRNGPMGGITMNLLVHAVDQLLSLFGPVSAVQAYLCPSASTGAPDRRASISLKFANGLQALVQGSTEFSHGQGESLTITGTQGRLVVKNNRVINVNYRTDRESSLVRVKQFMQNLVRPSFGSTLPIGTFADQIADFVQAIRENRLPVVSLQDGLAALEVVLAARKSDLSGQTIQMPLAQ